MPTINGTWYDADAMRDLRDRLEVFRIRRRMLLGPNTSIPKNLPIGPYSCMRCRHEANGMHLCPDYRQIPPQSHAEFELAAEEAYLFRSLRYGDDGTRR